MQGTFLKAEYLFESDNVLLQPLDFRIGDKRLIHNHEFWIWGVNENTRELFRANGISLTENQTPHTDDVHNTIKWHKEYKAPNLKEDKDYRHKLCGGALIKNQSKQLKGKNHVLLFKLKDAESDYFEYT